MYFIKKAFPLNFFFFFWESFDLWHLLLMITLYHQTKASISFWYKRGLNPKFLIQPSETLLVELTGTHPLKFFWHARKLSNIIIFLYLQTTTHLFDKKRSDSLFYLSSYSFPYIIYQEKFFFLYKLFLPT